MKRHIGSIIIFIFLIIGVLHLIRKAPKSLDDVSYAEGYVLHISHNIVSIYPDSTKLIVDILNAIYDPSIHLSSDSLVKIENQFNFTKKKFSFTFDGQIMADIYHAIDSAGYAFMKIRYKSGIRTDRNLNRTKFLDFYQIKVNDKIVFDYDFSRVGFFHTIWIIVAIFMGVLMFLNDRDDANLHKPKT